MKMDVIAKDISPSEFTYECHICRKKNKPVLHRHGNGTNSMKNRTEDRLSHCVGGGMSMIIHITDDTLRKKK
jgi:hypothetical protein